MILYAPPYYNRFVCIADRCRHSCCIGWEIDVDEDTLGRYQALSEDYGECIRRSIETDEDGTSHFRLLPDERCPHLDERNLCRIILSLGEHHLCDICREHPRFYNETAHGMEVGLGMACEEAARLILTSDDYAEALAVGKVEGEPWPLDFDAVEHRRRVYEVLSDKALTYEQKLSTISGAYGVSPCILHDEAWRALLDSLEYMDERHRARFSVYTSEARVQPAAQAMMERALAYWIYRHATSAANLDEFRCALGLCLVFERLLCSMLDKDGAAELSHAVEAARILSEELEYSEQNTEDIRTVFEQAFMTNQ